MQQEQLTSSASSKIQSIMYHTWILGSESGSGGSFLCPQGFRSGLCSPQAPYRHNWKNLRIYSLPSGPNHSLELFSSSWPAGIIKPHLNALERCRKFHRVKPVLKMRHRFLFTSLHKRFSISTILLPLCPTLVPCPAHLHKWHWVGSERDRIQHKKILFPVISPDVSVTNSFICECFFGQGCLTNTGVEKGSMRWK